MPHRPTRRLLALVVALGLVATACSSDDDGDDATPSPDGAAAIGDGTGSTEAGEPGSEDWVYPGDEWESAPAISRGFDTDALERLADQAEAASSSCLAIVKDGVVVDERYWGGADAETPREAFSVTKSISSTLVGIAQDDGDLALTDSASEYIPAWKDTPAAAVTVENLVSNDSGREWSLGIDYGEMIGSPDKTAFAIDLGQPDPPGEVWAYNNSAIQTLDDVLSEATGEEPKDFAAERLLEPIGMDQSEMTTDPAGNTLTFMGLQTTCLNLARFGYLFLRGGMWDGEQVVSSEFVEAATGRSSTELNAGYGYLWWLNRAGRQAAPTVAVSGDDTEGAEEAQMAPGAPEDIFWALGLFSQIVAVIPSEGIVAVRMGDAPSEETPFTQTELTRGVLDAVTG